MKSIVCGGLVLLAAAAWADARAKSPAPLADLHVASGEIAVQYARATAESDTVGAFADARATPVQIVLAKGTESAPGHVVADGYALGLRQHWSQVAVVAAGTALDPRAYVAEIEFGKSAEPVEVSENAVEIRQVGTACKSEANSVSCSDGGGVPMPVGKRSRQVAGQRYVVKVRLFSPAPRAAVFEDEYSIHFADSACRDGLAAAQHVATAIAANALSVEPVSIRFESNADRLRCSAREL